MTNYNDGLWHGWNGGECPVHTNTEVEVAFFDGADRAEAGCFSWVGGAEHSIIAFRVLKEHREPREVHLLRVPSGCWYPVHRGTTGAVMFREVLPD